MRKMRICAIFSCCLALLLALTACGGSDSSGKSDSTGEPDAPQGYEGTWRYVHEDAEQWLDLVENGRAFRYDVQYDRVTTGSWVETEEGVSGAFPFGFDKASGGDYIKASYRGVGLELCDLMLEEEVRETTTDSDGNSTSDTSNKIVFVGQWLILDFHKELSADLGVFEGLRKRYDQIETENAEFNKRYGISCDSVHDAFYILTPNMMEHIMAMDRRAGGKVYLRFLREGKIHVAVNSRRDHFEVGSLNDADLPSLRMKFRGEVRYVTELIDALLTVDTLYKQ